MTFLSVALSRTDYIFIHKNLKKNLKNLIVLILDDGVDVEDFKFSTKTQKNCVYW